MAALLALRRAQASPQNERPATGLSTTTSVIAHPGINDGVEQVDDKVEQDGEYRDDHDSAHDQRVVAVKRCIDEIAADAWNGEDRLDDDRTGEQTGRRRACVGDDRQDGSTQRVLYD